MTAARPQLGFRILIGAVALIVALAANACGSDHPKRVYVFGDSLVSQATKYVKQQLRDDGFKASVASLAGTATCDWFQNVARARKQFHPDVVVMSFSGNALGRCMLHADGSALSGPEYEAKYRADTEKVLAMFGADVPVYLVGAPVSDTGDDRVFRIYEQIAKKHANVRFVDGGKYLTPNHRFAMTLPCLRGEPCTGPVVRGVRNNVVRAPDRAHFCPVAGAPGAPCPVYSSGAYRFAVAIAQAVKQGQR